MTGEFVQMLDRPGIDTVFDPRAAPAAAAEVERAGFRCAWVVETVRDPFIVLARAADATRDVHLGTAVAIAFARSPMTLAQSAHDVHRISGGRLLLGLGSQVRPHVTRRFGMPWSQPAARMREYVLALRAIWAAWNDRVPLDFRGEFYTHTLMTPTFDPGPSGFGEPPVLLGGVGARMTAVAGEVADGFLCGPLTTVESFRAHTRPALRAGRARSDRPEFTVAGMPLVVTGADAAATARVARATRKRLAFYASTPAYRMVLEVHGWGGLADRLHALSREGRWDDMADLVDDDVLDAFAVVAEPGDVAAALRKRWDGLADRVIATFADDPGEGVLADIARGAAPVIPDIDDLRRRLVGHRFPGGTVRVRPHEAWLGHDAMRSPNVGRDELDPMWILVVGLRGMGTDIAGLIELAGSGPDDGLLFGELGLRQDVPLRVGVPYGVSGGIVDVTRRSGRRAGVFDTVVFELELRDEEEASVAGLTSSFLFTRAVAEAVS